MSGIVVTHNAGQVIARMGAMLGSIAIDQRLARDLAEIIGGGMHDRATSSRNPDGTPYPRNAPSTVKRKGFDWPGIDTNEMLRRSNFTDSYRYFNEQFILNYSGPADKLGWFEGDNNYGISRIVWGSDPTIDAAVGDRMREHVDEKVKGG